MATSLLELTFPLVDGESALAHNETIEHLLVFVGDSDGILFLCLRVHASNVPWCCREGRSVNWGGVGLLTILNGCLDGRFVVIVHDTAHAIEQLPIVSFNLHVAHVGHLVLPRRRGRWLAGLSNADGSVHDTPNRTLVPIVLNLSEALLDHSILHGQLFVHFCVSF